MGRGYIAKEAHVKSGEENRQKMAASRLIKCNIELDLTPWQRFRYVALAFYCTPDTIPDLNQRRDACACPRASASGNASARGTPWLGRG